MTNLYSASANLTPSLGNVSHFSMPWSIFVEYVVDLTIEAYEKMRTEAQLKRDWHEEQLSAILADDYIACIANSRPGPHLIVNTEVRVIKEMMKSGDIHIRQAQKIDIKLYGSWQRDYNKVYFAWECKKIADRATDSNLITEYVSEGIYRFCDGDYSSDVENAGMIGYVLDGDVEDIVSSINQSMISRRRERRLSSSERLSISLSRRSLNHIYESRHARQNKSTVNLYHLFLTFTWVAQEIESSSQTTA